MKKMLSLQIIKKIKNKKMAFYDIVVVGCGLSGATSARLLAERGFKILMIEQKKHIGGQIYDYKNDAGITVHQYGPHIFHKEKYFSNFFLNM